MMIKGLFKWTMISSLIFASSLSGRAQSFDPGRMSFLSSCAACHGADGKGNGPLVSTLKVTPPDLTVLSRRNKGVFPWDAVYEVIDGRKQVEAHGTREMPVWGFHYIPSPYEAVNPTGGPGGTEATIEMHIRPLVDYLNRIQEK
jgi:mono/diheme cytochrome c family protein